MGQLCEDAWLVGLLQRAGLLQTPAHHRQHHIHARYTHYCILTNFVDPVLNALHFWEGAEWGIARLFGVHRRDDAPRAAIVLAREPEFFGEYRPVVRLRMAAELAAGGVGRAGESCGGVGAPRLEARLRLAARHGSPLPGCACKLASTSPNALLTPPRSALARRVASHS